MIDTLRGIGIILFIAALAGAIAYVGDRVGHQVGRKRLTLFGIRPRYTSTIVAIGTGVIIALVITLGAILASNEVKTAFFKLYSINQQIATLQQRQKELEAKVNSAPIVVPVNAEIAPIIGRFPKGSDVDTRYSLARDFYNTTTRFINQSLVPPLKAYEPPSDVDKRIRDLATVKEVSDANTRGDVLLVAIADHNLFAGDRADFTITPYLDALVVQKGQPIGQMTIPAGKSVSLALAYQQLVQHIVVSLANRGMPRYFIGTPQAVEMLPSAPEMQRMVTTGTGEYAMTAFAAEDIYPHTAISGAAPIIPIIVTLTAKE